MLEQILKKFNGKDWVEQIAVIAGNVQTQFSGDNEYNTFVLTLETAFPLPLWVGINKDYVIMIYHLRILIFVKVILK